MAFDPQLLAFLLNQRERRQQDERAAQEAEDRRTRQALDVGMGIAMQPDADIGAWLPLLRSQGLRPEHESALMDAQKAERGVRKRKEQEAQTLAQGQAAGGALVDPLVAPELTLPQVLSGLRSVESAGAIGGADPNALLGELDVTRIRSQAKAREDEFKSRADFLKAARQESREEMRLAAELRDKQFDNEQQLRGQYQVQSRNFPLAKSAFDNMRAAFGQRDAAGDLSLVINFTKLAKPGEQVTEGEFRNVAEAGGYGLAIARIVKKIDDKTGTLPTELRDSLMKQGRAIYQERLKSQKMLEREYRGISKRHGFDPRLVITDYITPDATPAPPPEQPDAVFRGFDEVSGNPIFTPAGGGEPFEVVP